MEKWVETKHWSPVSQSEYLIFATEWTIVDFIKLNSNTDLFLVARDGELVALLGTMENQSNQKKKISYQCEVSEADVEEWIRGVDNEI